MSNKIESIRYFIMSIAVVMFSISLFDAIYGFKSLIDPGVSIIYNTLGSQIAPNMVTLVVFDWRGFDTLGESLILVTAVLVVLLIFGKGKILDNKINDANPTEINSSIAAGDNSTGTVSINEDSLESDEKLSEGNGKSSELGINPDEVNVIAVDIGSDNSKGEDE